MSFAGTCFVMALIMLPFAAIVIGYNYYRWKLMRDLDITPIDRVRDGYVEIKGRPVPPNEERVSPILQEPCFYFRTVVEMMEGRGWRQVGEEVSTGTLVIEDDTGQATVRIGKNQPLDIKPAYEYDSSKHPGEALPPHLQAVLTGFGLPTSNAVGIPMRYRFRETVLDEDTEIYVMGHAVRQSGQLIVAAKSLFSPLVISDSSEEEVERRYYNLFRLSIVTVLALMAVVFILGLIKGM